MDALASIPWIKLLLPALAHLFTRLARMRPHVRGHAALKVSLVIGWRPHRSAK